LKLRNNTAKQREISGNDNRLKKLSILGEFGLISRIASESKQGTGVITGIGDDAAVTGLSAGMQLLTSTDMLLEDVHFRRSWHDPYRLGRKALAVSISDIAAMGGIPRWALLSLALPADTSLEFIDECTRGFLAMAAEQGVSLIGGDTCQSKSGLIISVTIMAEQYPDRVVRRSGAQAGDDIWVTGTLGDAALGLLLLEKEKSPHPLPNLPLEGGGVPESPPFQGEDQGGDGVACLISRLLDPTPRITFGRALAEAGLASAMIDISDGLLSDFGHIAEQSAVGGTLQLDAMPLSEQFRSVAPKFATSPYHSALCGGEDYELCFTSSPSNRKKIAKIIKKCGVEATPVGIVTNSSDGIVCMDGVRVYNPETAGFNHFT
jgi:thiamine-monophosphate kinase